MPQRTNSVAFCFLDKCYSSGLYFGYMKMPRVGDVVYSNFHKWRMLIGGAVLMVVFRPWNYQVIFDRETFAAVAFIILFGTMAGFSMYMQSVKLIGGVKAGLYACIEPVAATILSVVWMKVQFAPMDLLGFVLILATIFVLAIPTKEERRGAGIRG